MLTAVYIQVISVITISTVVWCDRGSSCTGSDVTNCLGAFGEPYRKLYVCTNGVCECSDIAFYIIGDHCMLKEDPGPVGAFKIRAPRYNSNNFTTATVSFQCPLHKEKVTNYTVTCEQISSPEKMSTMVVRENYTPGCFFRGRIGGLEPGNDYNCSVVANTKDGHSEAAVLTYHAPIGRPYLPITEDVLRLTEKTETSSTLEVCTKCLLDDKNGPIIFTAIVVSKTGKYDSRKDYNGINATKLMKHTTYLQAKKDDFQTPYITTKPNWLNNAGDKDMKYIVGDEDCSGQSEDSICNGPLDSGTGYRFAVFSCSEAGCDVQTSKWFTTDKSYLGLYIGLGVGAVVLVVVVVVIVVLMKKRILRF